MCSTPKSRGYVNHVTKLKTPDTKADDYLAMLRRASQRFESAQQARQKSRQKR